MGIPLQGQIIALWVVFLFGMVFHSQLAMMPLLYGESIAIPRYGGKTPVSHLWMMLGFFCHSYAGDRSHCLLYLTALQNVPLWLNRGVFGAQFPTCFHGSDGSPD
jgi:hypothetical protein